MARDQTPERRLVTRTPRAMLGPQRQDRCETPARTALKRAFERRGDSDVVMNVAQGFNPASSRGLRRLLGLLGFATYTIVVSAVVSEAIFRLTPLDRRYQRGIYQECAGCGYVYHQRPGFDGISSQGLRDREFGIPKPAGVARVLILGDSIVFGEHVKPEETFAKRLESLFQARGRNMEVINAGVDGYSAFNERVYYKERGRLFQPDVVIIAFCMNDIVDPLPHWNFTGRNLLTIPDDAIPNLRYHVDTILPRFRISRTREQLSRYSHIFLDLSVRFAPIGDPPPFRALPSATAQDGRRWPTYVTSEDGKSLEVLLDYASPEWQWLRRMYDDLGAAIRAEHAMPLFLFFPLDYQLNPDYPFLPQTLLMRYCAERAFDCLDLLPLFRADVSKRPFQRYRSNYLDIWHLSPEGHRIVAEEIAAYLTKHRLVPALNPQS